MKKQTLKNLLLGVLCLVTLGGLITVISNNVKSNDETSESTKDERKNLATFNFVSELDNYALDNQEKVVNFLTSSTTNGKVGIFGNLMENSESQAYAIKIYQNKELGLRVGSSSSIGSLGINLNNGFTFNRVKVAAVNYHRLKTDGSNTYNKQANGSSYTLNSKPVALPMNSDLSVADTVIESVLEFNEEQNQLIIDGTSGRPCFLSLELWTE